MLKITESQNKEEVLLKLEGKLIGIWINELEVQCKKYLDSNYPRILVDFSGVNYVDHEALRMLKKYDGRVLIKNLPQFVRSTLE